MKVEKIYVITASNLPIQCFGDRDSAVAFVQGWRSRQRIDFYEVPLYGRGALPEDETYCCRSCSRGSKFPLE